MIKKLCTLLLLACTAAPILAQQYSSSDDASFAPKKGQWQVSMVLGNSTFFNENTSYLLPDFTYKGGQVGLPGWVNESTDPGVYLNIGGFNNNNLVNIAGLQAKYFLSDCWDVNFMFSMNVNVTPKKDFVEGDYTDVPDMIIPAQKYINAQMTNNWYTSVGSNYYFKTRNERVHPYLGGAVGFQMARIETKAPYTGETYVDPDGEVTELPTEVYIAAGKAGQAFGIKAAAVAGIEYSLAKGFLVGFEMQPLAYRYDVLQICPKGFDKYNASHHNFKIFDLPVVKIGIRF
ncbi:MAG: BT1926 family outer membrane beta-barrel protein [Bacteroides sp.]